MTPARTLALLATVLALIGCAEFRGAGRDAKQAGAEVGAGARDAAKDIGHAAKDVARDVGDATRKAAREIRDELKDDE